MQSKKVKSVMIAKLEECVADSGVARNIERGRGITAHVIRRVAYFSNAATFVCFHYKASQGRRGLAQSPEVFSCSYILVVQELKEQLRSE